MKINNICLKTARLALFSLFILQYISCNFHEERTPKDLGQQRGDLADLDDSEKQVAAFTWLKQNLLDPYCQRCHSVANPSAGLILSSLDEINHAKTTMPMIVAGNAAESLLYTVIESGAMPLGGVGPNAELKTALKCWIDLGAGGELTAGQILAPGCPLPGSEATTTVDHSSSLPVKPVTPVKPKDPVTAIAFPGPKDAVFFKHVQELVLKPACVRCHNDKLAENNVNLESYESIRKTPFLIVPGDAESSDLFLLASLKSTSPDRMPPQPNAPLSEQQLDLIERWLQQGALENESAIAPVIKPVEKPIDTTVPTIPTDPIVVTNPGNVKKVLFQEVFAKVIEPHCLTCHNSTKAEEGVNLESYDVIMKRKFLVVTGDAASSDLYQAVKPRKSGKGKMPPSPEPQLSREQIELVESWINDGALDQVAPVPGTSLPTTPVEPQLPIDPSVDVVPTPPVRAPQLTFGDITTNIFQPFCNSCHKNELADLQKLIKLNFIVPQDPDNSRLYRAIKKNKLGLALMPQRPRKPLDDQYIEMMRLWIEQGAQP